MRLRDNKKKLNDVIREIAVSNPEAKIGINSARQEDSHRLYAEFRAKLPEIDYSPPEVYEIFVRKMQRKYQNEAHKIQRVEKVANSAEKPDVCAKCTVKAAKRHCKFVSMDADVAESDGFKRFRSESYIRAQELLANAYESDHESNNGSTLAPSTQYNNRSSLASHFQPQPKSRQILFDRMFENNGAEPVENIGEPLVRNIPENSTVSDLGIQPWLSESSAFKKLISQLQNDQENAEQNMITFCEVSDYQKFCYARIAKAQGKIQK